MSKNNRTNTANDRQARSVGKGKWPSCLPTDKLEPFFYPLILISVTLIVFAGSFSADFTFDDHILVLDEPRIRYWHFWDLWNLQDHLHGWDQQVRILTLMVDFALFGNSPVGYHVHNLLWHSLSVILFYLLLRKISGRATLSFFAALLFAVHPIHVEAVTNIHNRKELLCMAFLLSSFISYYKFIDGIGRKKWLWFMGTLLAFALALFSKQVSIVFPLSLIAYEYIFVPEEKRFLTKNHVLLSGGLLVGSVLLLAYVLAVLDFNHLKDSYGLKGYSGELSLYTVMITSARSFWGYIGLLVWPNKLCPDHLVKLSSSLHDPLTMLSWAGVISVVTLAFLLARRRPILSFGLFWFLIHYLPVSNLIPSAYILADRYMYIPSAGFCIAVSYLGHYIYHQLRSFNPRVVIAGTAVIGTMVIISYAQKTIAYNSYWKNENALWQYTLQCNPRSFIAYNNLGNHYSRDKSYQKAIENFTQAIELGFVRGYYNRGNVHYILENNAAAIQDYSQAITWTANWAEPHFWRGNVYLRLKKNNKAIEDYNRALEIDSDKSDVYRSRGLAFENLEQWTRAENDHLKAIALNESNPVSHFDLGRVYLRLGKVDAATRSLERAKELGYPKANDALALLRKRGIIP